MPMTATPVFTQTPISQAVALSATANTSRAVSTGVPTNGVLISPNTNTNGIRVDQIFIQGTGTTLAGQVVIWLYDGTNGYPIDELAVTVVTPSTTAPAFQLQKNYSGFVLSATHKLYATSQVASQLALVGMVGGAF